jgi:glycosyltransferase involved in cell wall biosynthesis
LKVVIFIDWFAPAYKAGGPIQSIVNLVNQPIEAVQYRIVCSNKDLDGQPLKDIPTNQWVRFNEHTEVWYNSKNRKIFRLLKEVSAWQPEIFFINGIYSMYYNFLPLIFGKANKKIISARGMLHDGALSQKRLKKKIYLFIWKSLGLHKRYCFHATNSEEKEFIQQAFGKSTIVHVVPNLPRILHLPVKTQRQNNALQVVSIGLISPMKNYLKVIEALADCSEGVIYTIYGAVKDAGYWKQCTEQMRNLPQHITVIYKGDIPSIDVPKALEAADVFILPSKSENFGHAIYEALTAGKPVITSHNTPWNGLKEAKAGFNVSPESNYELSEAICFFARADENQLTEWSTGAKAYAERSIDIHKIKSQYKKMFQV